MAFESGSDDAIDLLYAFRFCHWDPGLDSLNEPRQLINIV